MIVLWKYFQCLLYDCGKFERFLDYRVEQCSKGWWGDSCLDSKSGGKKEVHHELPPMTAPQSYKLEDSVSFFLSLYQGNLICGLNCIFPVFICFCSPNYTAHLFNKATCYWCYSFTYLEFLLVNLYFVKKNPQFISHVSCHVPASHLFLPSSGCVTNEKRRQRIGG